MILKEKINEIGASYFISYLYSKYIDKSHIAYKRRTTDKTSTIEGVKSNYYDCICEILDMSSEKLNTNAIGLSGEEIINMAKELKVLFEKYSVMTIHLKSVDGNISLKDLSDYTGLINEAIMEYKYKNDNNTSNMNYETIIKDVYNGSIIIDFLIGVESSVVATLIIEIGKYVVKKIKDKINNHNDDNNVNIDEESNTLVVDIDHNNNR